LTDGDNFTIGVQAYPPDGTVVAQAVLWFWASGTLFDKHNINTHYAVLGIYSSSVTAWWRANSVFARTCRRVVRFPHPDRKRSFHDTLCAVFGFLITRASNFLHPASVGDDGRQHSR